MSLSRYLPTSSIAKKYVMGVTGLLLCGFLVGHLAGNFLILVGQEAFNNYADALINNPLIYFAETGLALLFLLHIGMGVLVTIENKKARPDDYTYKVKTGRGATFASSTMPYTGMIILVFLVLHLIHFRFGADYRVTHDGQEMRDLYRLVVEVFSRPGQVVWYVFCQIVLGIHVSHGFSSAFQSLGLNHPAYTPKIKILGLLFGIFIALGFSIIPLYIFFYGG